MRGDNLLFPVYRRLQKTPRLDILANQILNVVGKRTIFLCCGFDGEHLQPWIQTEPGENLGDAFSVHGCTLSVNHQKRKDQNDKNL